MCWRYSLVWGNIVLPIIPLYLREWFVFLFASNYRCNRPHNWVSGGALKLIALLGLVTVVSVT